MIRTIAACLVCLSLVGCTDTLTARSADRKGPSCISLSELNWANVRDTRTIDFRLRDGTTRVNRLDAPCSNLLIVGAFQPVGGQAEYCAGDEVLVPNPQRGVGEPDGTICKLGSFTPASR